MNLTSRPLSMPKNAWKHESLERIESYLKMQGVRNWSLNSMISRVYYHTIQKRGVILVQTRFAERINYWLDIWIWWYIAVLVNNVHSVCTKDLNTAKYSVTYQADIQNTLLFNPLITFIIGMLYEQNLQIEYDARESGSDLSWDYHFWSR